eukprot:CAMPEP_0184704048 /NCGR_PEP_ID=MMETSP0313-20130426/29950_1 /TAXON_ID=2792 /ORGANISM="Porphyridium aerugineum, Strain SAG 1380-2" /LENGTH=125 /DNA_ID=CAMNT_0027164999 /DNA_START=167 /DNA_END=540 /DNA_ORIENTATION=+
MSDQDPRNQSRWNNGHDRYATDPSNALSNGWNVANPSASDPFQSSELSNYNNTHTGDVPSSDLLQNYYNSLGSHFRGTANWHRSLQPAGANNGLGPSQYMGPPSQGRNELVDDDELGITASSTGL